MPHALNFYQFQFIHDLINNPIVAETLRPAQFFHTMGKGVFRQIFNGLDIRPSVLAGNLRRSLRVDFSTQCEKARPFSPFLNSA